MATIKSYTTVEQSRRLAEILSLKSADMCFVNDGTSIKIDANPYNVRKYMWKDVQLIPCWSLAALLNVLPKEIFNGEYVINITEGCDENWVITYDHIDNKSHSFYGLSTGADNLIDACYEMILKLHELKIL